MELVPLRYLQKQKSRFFFHCCCAAAAAHDPLLFLKFPLESVIFGRISKKINFLNSARKVRKNGIGPIKIHPQTKKSIFRVDAFFIIFFPSDSMPNEGEEATKTRPRKKIDFFVFGPIWMGPIPFFLTFHAEFKKFIFF